MFNDLSQLDSYLATRRSSRPRDMVAPGLGDDDIRAVVETALRTPDHGKLAPWRVISVAADQRDSLAEAITRAYKNEKPEAGRLEIEALDTMAHLAPTLLVVLASPVQSTKIPQWEQDLSCGAFCMNLLHAIHARGFVGGWITGWPAYNDAVRDLFGQAPDRIAGFLFAGTAGSELAERARPDLGTILRTWEGPAPQ